MNSESSFKEERVERVGEMVEDAESKVQFVKSLHSFVLGLDDEKALPMDSKRLEATLQEKFDLHINEDEKLRMALVKIEEQKALKAEMDREREQFKLVPQDEKTKDDFISHRKYISEKLLDFAVTDSDANVKYLRQIQAYIEYLAELKEDRDKFKDLYDQDGGVFKKDGRFVNGVTEFFNERYAEYRNLAKKKHSGFKGHNLGRANYGNYLEGVDFRGLGVVLVFNERAQHRLRDFNYVAGRRFPESSVSFCYENEEKELVHSHEYNHALFGCHETHKTVYEDQFLRIIKRIVNPDWETELIMGVYGEGSSKDELLEKIILGYKNDLMGEIFADLSNIFDHRLADGFYGHLTITMNVLDKYTDGLQDEHLREVIKNAKHELMLSVNRYNAELGELVYLARKLDMVDDTMAGMLVFGGDARKALRHFKKVVGEERLTPLLDGYDSQDHKIYRSVDEKKVFEMVENIYKKPSIPKP